MGVTCLTSDPLMKFQVSSAISGQLSPQHFTIMDKKNNGTCYGFCFRQSIVRKYLPTPVNIGKY